MKLSPFGMDTCCICDAPTTHAVEAEHGEWLPVCAKCAQWERDTFPGIRIALWDANRHARARA